MPQYLPNKRLLLEEKIICMEVRSRNLTLAASPVHAQIVWNFAAKENPQRPCLLQFYILSINKSCITIFLFILRNIFNPKMWAWSGQLNFYLRFEISSSLSFKMIHPSLKLICFWNDFNSNLAAPCLFINNVVAQSSEYRRSENVIFISPLESLFLSPITTYLWFPKSSKAKAMQIWEKYMLFGRP